MRLLTGAPWFSRAVMFVSKALWVSWAWSCASAGPHQECGYEGPDRMTAVDVATAAMTTTATDAVSILCRAAQDFRACVPGASGNRH